jgi:hypothetical protein
MKADTLVVVSASSVGVSEHSLCPCKMSRVLIGVVDAPVSSPDCEVSRAS